MDKKVIIPLPPKPPKVPALKPTEAMTPTEEKNYIKNHIDNNDFFPTDIPVKSTIGKLLMWPQPIPFHHKAIPMLNLYAKNGCPVECGTNWSREHIELLLHRGPHRSSTGKDATIQLKVETDEKIKQGYARIVTWGSIKNNIPPTLKLSPVAMIPHKSKKFRCILDLSFNLKHKGITYPSVNDQTIPKSEAASMVQLGLTLKRIISTMADNWDPTKPFIFTKLDIKDGFWRMSVNNTDAWNFCYVLPDKANDKNHDNIRIVVPNSLQMGWCESPPLFCSGTETARDIIAYYIQHEPLPPHKFERKMLKETSENNTKDDKSVRVSHSC